jgi:hypothetical protein
VSCFKIRLADCGEEALARAIWDSGQESSRLHVPPHPAWRPAAHRFGLLYRRAAVPSRKIGAVGHIATSESFPTVNPRLPRSADEAMQQQKQKLVIIRFLLIRIHDLLAPNLRRTLFSCAHHVKSKENYSANSCYSSCEALISPGSSTHARTTKKKEKIASWRGR